MFSAIGSHAVTRTGSLRSAMPKSACTTAAEPAISDFMSSMLFAGFSEMPPESKVMPLPTKLR